MCEVITVDGPVGSGKGTIAALLARKLGWHLLDSGALYRSLALLVAHNKCDLRDIDCLTNLAKEMDIVFCTEHNSDLVLLNQKDISLEIRSETCAKLASEIAVLPQVREALLLKQREFRKLPGLVADGRDMGTIVFPDAKLKFFLDAELSVRIQRRYHQLQGKGINVNLPQLEKEITERDARDRNRLYAPLRAADDAIIIDSTSLGVSIILEKMINLIREKLQINI